MMAPPLTLPWKRAATALLALAALLAGCTAPADAPAPAPAPRPEPGTPQVMCSMDAKQCPNGQWVGRTPPTCQFICPGGAPAAPR